MKQSQIDAIKAAHGVFDVIKRQYDQDIAAANFILNWLILDCDHLNPDGSSAVNSEGCMICRLDVGQPNLRHSSLSDQSLMIRKLREKTGCGLIEGKIALEMHGWDMDNAIQYLRTSKV